MGFSNTSKKNASSHSEKVAYAYKQFIDEMFPGEQEQASNIIISLAKIFGLNLEECDAEKYRYLLSVYLDVYIRRTVTQSSDESILACLHAKHGDLVKSEDTAQRVLAFATINIKNNNFVLTTDADLTALDLALGVSSSKNQTVNRNTEAEQANLNDPEYGLVKNKPIYTKGVRGSRQYIESLKTAMGEQLTWNRRGSMIVHGINGMIDIYDSTLPSGKPYKTLYVNMYGSENSEIVPKGFSK